MVSAAWRDAGYMLPVATDGGIPTMRSNTWNRLELEDAFAPERDERATCSGCRGPYLCARSTCVTR